MVAVQVAEAPQKVTVFVGGLPPLPTADPSVQVHVGTQDPPRDEQE